MKKETPPSWDLSHLYKSVADPAIDRDLKSALKRAEDFNKKYKGKIKPEAFKEYEALLELTTKLGAYAHLVYYDNDRDQKNKAFLQKIEKVVRDIGRPLLFFELEIINLPKAQIEKLIKNLTLSRYRRYLEKVLLEKPHRLTEAEERIFIDLGLSGNVAWTRFFGDELSYKKFNGQSLDASLKKLYNHDRSVRQTAAKNITEGLKEESRRLSFIYNTLAEDKAIRDRYCKFSTPEAARHLANETDRETVNVMIEVIMDNYQIVKDFYKFKAKVLGLKTLYDYDRYAPIIQAKKHYEFSEAKKLVLDSFAEFSPLFHQTAKKFFDAKWIDAPMREGKREGAFCYFVGPNNHPYVLLNYVGSQSDVLTLAHELGHGVHAVLSQQQSFLNYHVPLTVAETASVFAESLVFDKLKNLITDRKERLALYIKEIEEMFATMFRQVAMYKFEQDFHNLRRTKGELSVVEINQLWRRRQEEMFGDSVKLTPDYDWWWLYIWHFYREPFYVYSYAFGQLLALALYVLYKKEGKSMVAKYINMLESGSSLSPEDLVGPLGINLRDKKFWEGGINLIKEMVAEAKALQ